MLENLKKIYKKDKFIRIRTLQTKEMSDPFGENSKNKIYLIEDEK
jgi:hypothetical protein